MIVNLSATPVHNCLDAIRLNAHYDSLQENWRKFTSYFRRSDSYWKVSPPVENGNNRRLGAYPIDFSIPLRCGHYAHLDHHGVPVRRSPDGRQFIHNYTRICGFALAHWNLYQQGNDKAHLAPVLAVADYILATAKRTPGEAALRTERPGEGHSGELSSMSQGQAMSVLCRAWQATGRSEYLETALACLHPFTIPAQRGGILDEIAACQAPWFEEWPGTPASHILNGMIFAIWGLADVVTAAACPQACALYEIGINSLVRALPSFDSGFWSWYSIREQGKPYIASMMYHNLHVALLTALFRQTLNKSFERWSDVFRSYGRSYRCRLRAAAAIAEAKYRLMQSGNEHT